jgi:hypothetical protein
VGPDGPGMTRGRLGRAEALLDLLLAPCFLLRSVFVIDTDNLIALRSSLLTYETLWLVQLKSCSRSGSWIYVPWCSTQFLVVFLSSLSFKSPFTCVNCDRPVYNKKA